MKLSLCLRSLVLAFAIALPACSLSPATRALAADNATPTEMEQGELAPIRARIKAKDFKGAAEDLFIMARIVQNADVYNLLAFSLRNLGDYKQAALYYRKALDYDASHKSALEYQGELFIALGDIPAARANLARLEKLCPQGCEELDDLRAALGKPEAGKIQNMDKKE